MNWTQQVFPLVAVVLDENDSTNTSHPIEGCNFGDIYLVMGEVSCYGVQEFDEPDIHDKPRLDGIRHYVLLNLSTGQILPGMFHAERFRSATVEEL